jgi:hypothetical protein
VSSPWRSLSFANRKYAYSSWVPQQTQLVHEVVLAAFTLQKSSFSLYRSDEAATVKQQTPYQLQPGLYSRFNDALEVFVSRNCLPFPNGLLYPILSPLQKQLA